MCTYVGTVQSPTHLANHHAQQRMTSIEDVENGDNRSLSAIVDIKGPRTRDLNTVKEEENIKRLIKLELMKTPIAIRSVLSHLFCRHHPTGND